VIGNLDKLQDIGRSYQPAILKPILVVKINSADQTKPLNFRLVQKSRNRTAKIDQGGV